MQYENARSGGIEKVSTVSIPEGDFLEKVGILIGVYQGI